MATTVPTATPMTVKEKIAAANKARDAAKLSDADAAALADNEALIKAQEEQAEAESKARDASLLRRLVAMQEIHGVDKVRPVAIKGSTHTFIVKGNQAAHAKWQAKFTASVTNKKIDKVEIDRDYAVSCIVDWNGETDFSDRDEHGFQLIKFLRENSGIVSPIWAVAATLNGFIAEEAKS